MKMAKHSVGQNRKLQLMSLPLLVALLKLYNHVPSPLSLDDLHAPVSALVMEWVWR